MSNYSDKYWLAIIILLLLGIVSGGIILAIQLGSHQPVEISLTPTPISENQWEIYIDGAVANPGLYPADEDDTISTLIHCAGLMPDANLNQIKIHVPRIDETNTAQKISLNRADAWLLEVLPGIGKIKAQAVVDYRNQHGHFRRIEDLLKVSGIGKSTLDNIKDLISVE